MRAEEAPWRDLVADTASDPAYLNCNRSLVAWSRRFVEVVVVGRHPVTGTYRQRICLQFLCRGLSQTLFTGTDDCRCTSSLPRP